MTDFFKALISNVKQAMAVEQRCQTAYSDAEAAAVRARKAMERAHEELCAATVATQTARGELNRAIDEELSPATVARAAARTAVEASFEPAHVHDWEFLGLMEDRGPLWGCRNCSAQRRLRDLTSGSHRYRENNNSTWQDDEP